MKRITLGSIPLAIFALTPATVSAADVNTQPLLDFRVEHNDNFGLSPTTDADSDVVGYIADLAALVDIATPRSDTSIRPRVRLQEFPDRDDLERVEGFFDIASHVRGERGNGHFLAGFQRRDVYNTETPTGEFDPLDPGIDDPEAGPIVVGETRTRVEFQPSFDYRITERASIGAGAYLNTTRYDADEGVPTKTDYDYGVFQGFVTWASSPASDFTVGAYASRYEATDDSQDIDAVGGLLGYEYRWSERSGIEARVFFEENDITDFVPVRVDESESNVGGELTVWHQLEVSTWRFSVGRSFTPSGDSGKSEFDQFRLEYDRRLSPRLDLKGVARYDARRAIGSTDTVFDRDYARVDLSLRWFMSPTWYIGGGYAYMWVDRELATGSGENNKFYVNVGYRGLSRASR